MIQDKEKFNFKFLNTVMYIGAIIGIYYVLKNIGIMDKIMEAFASLTPVFLGLLICWITMPLANKLKKLGFSKNMSAFLSLIIIFGIIIALFSFVIPLFVDQLSSLIRELPSIYNTLVQKVNSFITETLHFERAFQLTENIKDLDVKGLEIIQSNLGNIVDYSINTIQSVISIIVTIATTIVVSFFMVKDIDKFKSGIISFFSKNKKDTKRYNMIIEIDEAIMSYIKGMAIDSFIVGLLTAVICMVLGLDYAILFGILIMVLNLIPYIGAIVSYTITSLYALTVGGPVLAVITLICLVVVQIIDANILQPNIVAKSVNLHPVVVLSGLIVFQLLFGIFGMIMAVPVLAIIKIVLKYKFSINFEEDEVLNKKSAEVKRRANINSGKE